MNEISSDVAPEGWHTVIPRIVVENASQLVWFLQEVFSSTGQYQKERPSEIKIGDSIILISDAGVRPPMTAFLYVYVNDVDAVYERALKAGARSVEEPFETPYGDRRSMIEDQWGNTWQIAQRKISSVSEIQFQRITPQFTVPDVVAAAKYYSEVLGFENRGFFGEPPVFAIVRRGPLEIFFNHDPGVMGKSRVRAKGAYDTYIHVTNVDALAEELRHNGARIIEEPEDRIYGMRELVIEDCHGLRLAFGQQIH